MSPIEIESWTLRVLAEIEAGRTYEDSRVELKSIFPLDAAKTARQIAAHANAARGTPILWIIGADSEQGVLGIEPRDLASWFPSVKSAFAGVYTTLSDVVVPFDGKVVQALQFDTDRAPYLVNNSAGGTVQREVPWREGTTTRTATREELLLIMQADAPLPDVEVLSARINPVENHAVSASMEVYVVPKGSDRAVFPFHRCSAKIICGGGVVAENLKVNCHTRGTSLMARLNSDVQRHISKGTLIDVKGGFEPVEVDQDQIMLSRPAKMNITIIGRLTNPEAPTLSNPSLEVTLGVADSRYKACVIAASLTKISVDKNSKISWVTQS